MKRVVVIGGGPGGYTAAIKAAKLGAQVTLIEMNEIGGVCTNWGCIPTKIYKNASHILELKQLAPTFGVDIPELRLDFKRLFAFKKRVVQQLQMGIKNLLASVGVNLISGRGSFINEHKVKVESDTEVMELEADGFIVATGSKAKSLPVSGGDLDELWTNKEILESRELPKDIVIVGGGVVGVEFASILASFGVEVTIVEILPHILYGMEPEIIELIENTFERKLGIKLVLGSAVSSVAYGEDKFTLELSRGEKLVAERVLVAIGREPTDTADLFSLGARNNGRFVARNRYLQTSIPNIYAIGDFAGEPFLAHKAYIEGEIAAMNLVEDRKCSLNYDAIPKAIFTTPEIGSVGLTEKEAKERGYEVKVLRYNLAMLGRAAVNARREGFIKAVMEERTGRLLGIHMVGQNASEVLAAATVAVAKGLTMKDFEDFVFAHPTMSEGLREALFM